MAIPDEFRGIKFHSWLDVFLEYALILAKSSNVQDAYDIISIASGANVFYHSPECMFLIHVCWFSRSPFPIG
jgi:general transcription factor 3C polypeptide 3 (transcription factor C subunit 4)